MCRYSSLINIYPSDEKYHTWHFETMPGLFKCRQRLKLIEWLWKFKIFTWRKKARIVFMTNWRHFLLCLLIHSADPESRTVVIIVVVHIVRSSVRPHISKSSKAKQITSENNIHYWRDCGSGRVDHWWFLSFRTVLHQILSLKIMEIWELV